MKKITKSLVALAVMFCLMLEVSAVVYRTGFQQFRYGCAKDKEADLTVTYDSITDATKLDVTAKTLMASINGTGNVVNPVTGVTWKWGDTTTFGYETEIWLEPGTYTFWGCFDDGGAVVINDEVIYTHGNQSGYNVSPPSGDFVVTTAGWYDFRGYVWDWAGGKCPIGDAKSAIQMKKDGGDWIIDMAGVPTRFVTGEEFVEISKVLPTETEDVFEIKAIVNFPEGVPANVYVLGATGNIGYTAKENWALATEAVAVTGTGAAQELSLMVDVTSIEDPFIVVYSESTHTDGLSETAAADPQWNTRYAYSTIMSTDVKATGDVSVVETDYERVVVSANISGFGTGSDSLVADLEFSALGDFSDAQVVSLGSLSIGSVSYEFTGLTTNTTYSVRLKMVNSSEVTSYSPVLEVTTLNPQPAVLTAKLYSCSYNTFVASVTMTDYGAGSTTANLGYQVSDKADFSDILVDKVFDSASLNSEAKFEVTALDDGAPLWGASTYYLRAVSVNEWGVIGYSDTVTINLDDTIVIYDGFGFEKKSTSLDVFGNVSYLALGVTYDVKLDVNGVVTEWTNQSDIGSFTYTVAKENLLDLNTVKMTITAHAYEGDFVYEIEQTFVKTQESVNLVAKVTDLDDNNASFTVAKIGDRFKLPTLSYEKDYYVAGDTRVAKLLDDGQTVEIIGHGFTKVAKRIVDPVTGTITVERGLVVVPPTPAGEGNVYMLIVPQADRHWTTATWTNLTNPEAGGYPSKKDDVAMIFMYGTKSLFVNQDITVGQIWIGAENGNFHFRGPGGGFVGVTINFERSDKQMPLFRISGLEQTDDVVLPWSMPEFNLVCNSAARTFTFDCSNDLLFDAGCPIDPQSREDVYNMSMQRVSLGEGCIFNIPKDAKVIFDGTNAGRKNGDSQRDNATFRFLDCEFIGEGTVDYNGPASMLFTPYASNFNGLFDLTQMNKYDDFKVQNRGGGLYMVFWEGRQPGSNATQRVEGHVGLGSSTHSVSWDDSFGIINGGSAHGYGSYGPVPNHWAPKAFYTRGGGAQIHLQSNDEWAKKGILDSIWASEQLIVEDGLTYFSSDSTTHTNYATNSVLFAEASNPDGKGVIAVNATHIRSSNNSSYVVDGVSTYRGRFQIGNFQELAIGEGSAENAKIIPWVVNCVGGAYAWFFATADEDGFLLPMGVPPTENLRNFGDTANAYLVGGNTLNLLQDKTVNSLVLKSVVGERSALGEGMTATITSGGLIFTHEISRIDTEEIYNAGTRGNLVFPNRAFIFAGIKSETSPSEIWANISAPEGMTISYPGTLLLGGDQTGIDEEIHLANSNLILGKNTTPAVIDVPITMHSGGSSLTIANEGSLCRQEIICTTATRQVPQINVAFDGVETCQKLTVDGETLPRGTYGATGSGAEFINDRMFKGTGILKVLSDDLLQPTIILMF